MKSHRKKGNVMARAILMAFFIGVALFAGCTPSSENIARKAEAVGGDRIVQQGFVEPDSGSVVDVDRPTERIIERFGPTIKLYAGWYGFDWRFVLAVMKQESRFRHRAESRKGARGLMQIMPVTGLEVARKLDLRDLSHPDNNIRGGIFYLRKLYDMFEGAGEADRLKLTLAAYNAGVSRVYDAQDLAAYFQQQPDQWTSVKDALPLLSKRYYTLHRNVWGQEKPRGGWFGNAKETLNYVDAVMDYYDEYRVTLN
jgi:membrane-bound lytic murein transglycosylase F